MGYESKRTRLEALRASLEAERSNMDPKWRDLADYIKPSRGRFLTSATDRNRPASRSRIVDSTGALASRTLASGMQSGITNQARHWLRMTTEDPDLAEWGPVKDWLHIAETRALNVFRRSNLYNSLHVVWGDMGTFGTAALVVVKDAETTVRSTTLPIGSYSISANNRGIVDTCVRHYSMTVRQMVEEFGLDRLSQTAQRLWSNNKGEAWVEVCHVISPNREWDARSPLAKHKRYASCYYEIGGDHEAMLRESGFDRFPILCPRWEVDGEDVYGTCPGMDALPDIRQLQTMVKDKARAVKKMIDPALVAGPELRNSTVAGIAGGITYSTFKDGRPQVAPLHEVRPPVTELREDINEVQQAVRRAFYEDLFLMLAMSDRRQITAREVAERHEEKLIMLGPVLQRTDTDLLNPLNDIVFDAMLEDGMLPPPPEEMEGQELKVEYINTLAQAQRMLGIGGVESLLGVVQAAATIKPDVVDKIDLDQVVDEYGEKLGVSPRLIVSDERVAEIRGNRAKQQQAAAQAEQMQAAAGAAKDLSAANTGGDNALAALLRGLGQPAA